MRTVIMLKLRAWRDSIDPVETFSIPSGYKVLSLELIQRNHIHLWVEVDSDNPKEELRIHAVTQGMYIPDKAAQYFGTAQLGEIHAVHFYGELTPMQKELEKLGQQVFSAGSGEGSDG